MVLIYFIIMREDKIVNEAHAQRDEKGLSNFKI